MFKSLGSRLAMVCVAAVLAAFSVAAWAQDDDERPVRPRDIAKPANNVVTITMTGAGMTKDEAIRDAQRKALEKGAGAYIYSQSKTKDFELVKDTIIARCAGFVQHYDVVKSKQVDDGTWEVTIKAEVSVKGIEDTWGVVQNLLKEMGRPKIMVFIKEEKGREIVDDSKVQTKIEELLLKSGFALVDRNQIKEIDRKDLDAAVNDEAPKRAAAIAKRFGAQLLVSGSAKVQRGDESNVYGVHMFTAEAEAKIRSFRSDTGQLVSAIPCPTQRGVQRVQNSAYEQALGRVGDEAARRVQDDVLQHWMDVLEGRGEVQIHVENVNFKQYQDLKKALKKIKGVNEVTGEFHDKVAELSLQSDLRAEKLADKITDAIPELEVSDISANVVKAKMKAAKD